MNVAHISAGLASTCGQILRRDAPDRENLTVATFDPLQISTAGISPRGAGKSASTRAPRPAESFETTLTQASLPTPPSRERALVPAEASDAASETVQPRGRDNRSADAGIPRDSKQDLRQSPSRRDEPPAPPPPRQAAADGDKPAGTQAAKPDDVDASSPDIPPGDEPASQASGSDNSALEDEVAIASAALGIDQPASLTAPVPEAAPAPLTVVIADGASQAQAAAAATALAGNGQAVTLAPLAGPADAAGTTGKIAAESANTVLALPVAVPQSSVNEPDDSAVTLPTADSAEAKPASAKPAPATADIAAAQPAQPPLAGAINSIVATFDQAGAAQANAAPLSVQPKAETPPAVSAAPLADAATAAPAANTTITQAPLAFQQPAPVATLNPTDATQIIRENVPLDRLGVEIATTARAGIKEIAVRLDPPELGRIDVRIDIDDSGQVNTHLVVERASTLDQLRRDAPNLERLLNQSGLKADSGSLQFSLQDQNQPYRQQGGDGRRTRRSILAIDGISGIADPASTLQAAYVAPSRQGIDVRL